MVDLGGCHLMLIAQKILDEIESLHLLDVFPVGEGLLKLRAGLNLIDELIEEIPVRALPDALILRSHVCIKLGRWNEAHVALTEAYRINSRCPNVLTAIWFLYMMIGATSCAEFWALELEILGYHLPISE